MYAGLHRLLPIPIALTLLGCICDPGLQKADSSRPLANRLATLNRDLPSPVLPPLQSRQSVRWVDENGVLLLHGGQEIALAGVDCDARMIAFMRALFFGNEPDTLVYLPSGYVLDSVRYAYVWDIAVWELGDPDLEFAPATSSLNELGLTSGWCRPMKQDYHSYHRRYVAISKLYQ